MKSQRGIALVVVLWVLVLLSAIATGFSTSSHTEVRIARNMIANAQARALADGGIYRAIQKLINPGADNIWRADGSLRSLDLGGERLLMSIQDEGGKIDLNAGAEPLLINLFRNAGLDADASAAMVDAIVDWRDRDHLVRLNGAEDNDYRAADKGYGAKDAPFDTVEELLQVIGMTAGLYARVAPALTVYSRRIGVDPATAPIQVLRAIPGVDSATIEEILANRALGNTAAPTPAGLRAARAFLSRASRQVFTLRSLARTAGGGVFMREAVVRLARDPDRPYRFHVWRRAESARFTAPGG